MRAPLTLFVPLLLVVGPAHGKQPAEAAPVRSPADAVPGEPEFNSCVRLPASRRVKVSLKPGSELKDLVAWISSMTCKRFIVAQGARSQPVTLTSPTPISAGEAYRAFVSALEVMGLTVVPSGRFLKVVPAAWAVQSPTPVYADGEQGRLPAGEEVVTQLLRVQHAGAAELAAALSKMKSRSGDVSAYLPGGALILTDTAANVRRMARIVAMLDVPNRRGEIWVVRPRHADPEELAKLLGELFAGERATAAKGGASPSEGAARFVVDGASGALLVVAQEAVFRRVRAVIEAVDVQGQGLQARAWVYRLKHGDAEKIAQELSGLGAGAASSGAARRGRRGASTAAAAGETTLFEGKVQISPIKAQNSLLVVASPRDYLQLRRVIQEIDQPRRQVFIEAYILEVKLDKQRDLGLALHGGKLFDSASVYGGLAHGSDLTSATVIPSDLMGLALGIRGPVVEGSGEALGLGVGNDIPAFGIALRAMQENHDVDVLSSPHLLTTDNEESEILVGKNIPQRSGGSSLPSSGSSGEQQQQLTLLANLVPSVEHVDVGLRLKLTPTIGDGDTVRLKLEQKADEVDKVDFGGLGASTSRKEIRTTVTVNDRQTVVIGGLIDRRSEDGESKIPLLGDIPILGYLFRRQTKHTVRTNMLVILTPYIVRDQADLHRIFAEKLRERQDFIRRYTAYKERLGLSPVDYRYKRGLLAEINSYGARLEAERELEQASRPPEPGPRIQQVP